jgi:hypothetical protein|tara:strand:- start:1797 stop:2105 length:309 start_codon:yes stop_codon:yes gene_type:complete
LTKRFHKCDETCKINHKKKVTKTVIPKTDKKFVETVFGNVPVSAKNKTKTKPEVVNVYSNKPKIEAVWKIINLVDEIDNSLETNKVLEKTLITLRKLQQDIA